MIQRFKRWASDELLVGAYVVAGWLGDKFGFHVTHADWQGYHNEMLDEWHKAIQVCNELTRQREALRLQLKLLSSHSNTMLVVSENVDVLLNALAADIHRRNAHWWTDISTGEPVEITDELVCTKLVLIHSEISEALEGWRKSLPDDKLPHRPMFDVELADAIIRILDLAAATQADIGGALKEKLAVNATRLDHKKEARLSANGKRF